jgi:peptide/nickel transport system substrate-binding protein
VTTAAKTKLTIGISPIPQVMHPHLDSGASATSVYRALFDPLVNAGSAGGIEPWLAESWRIIDPLTWEFKIRPGVKFHNGEVFDAAAAKWNLDWARNPDNKSIWNGRVTQIASTEVVDANTLRIKTANPYGALLDGLTIIWMMPPAHYQQVGPDGFKSSL